jgi:uncharacterized membrane protein
VLVLSTVLVVTPSAVSAVLIAATDGQALQSPWFLVPSTVGILVALLWLVIRVVQIGNDQILLANRQAEVLVKPLREEVNRLRDEVRDCNESSESERLWHQILVARLENVVRKAGLPIPEETWRRP